MSVTANTRASENPARTSSTPDFEFIARLHRGLDEAVSDAQLTRSEIDLRTRVRDIVQREVAPRAALLDEHGVFAHDSYQALARAGLDGIFFPKELGGMGQSTVAYAVAMEEIASACGATSLVYMTQTHAAYPITLAGRPDLVRRYVPPLLSGKMYGSLAITEPDAGSDASSLRTTARRDGDSYVIDGSKTFITTGDRADVIVVFATTDRSAGRNGITAFVVDGDTPGLSRGQPLSKMGMHGSSTAELFFDGVRVAASARLGSEGSGWKLLTRSVVRSRVSAAAQGVGLARGAYVHGLAAIGAEGARDPKVGFVLANLRSRVLAARLLVYATARTVDRDPEQPLTAEIAMMKMTCTDLAMDVALSIMDLLGWAGDLHDVIVERYARDAKVTQIYDGTNEIQRLLIARDIVRRLQEVVQ